MARLPLLLLIIALVYLPTALNGFASDDLTLVLEHQPKLSQVPAFFASDLWEGHSSGYYRPLFTTSIALDGALWPGQPGLYHLHSVAWHLLACGLLFGLVRRMAGEPSAWLATLIFGLHPLQSEGVIFIASRNDPMAAALVFGGLLLLRPSQDAAGTRAPHLALGALALTGALLCKESAVLWVLLGTPILDLARSRGPGSPGGSPRESLGPRLPAWGAGLAACLVWFGLRTAAVTASPPLPGLGSLIARLPEVAAHYLGRALVPWPLSDGHTLIYLDLGWSGLVLGILALAVALSLALRGPALSRAGLALALLAGLPALAGVASKLLLAERYAYLPVAGLALALGAAFPPSPRARWLLLVVLVPLWGGLLQLRIPDWRDSLSLARSAAEDLPSGYSHSWLGHELHAAGASAEALPWFTRALEAEPPYCAHAAEAVEAALGTSPDAAEAMAARGFEAGCAGVPGFRAAWATTRLLAGDLAGAEAILTPPPPCQGDLAVPVATVALARQDATTWETCLAAAADPGALESAARALGLQALPAMDSQGLP